MLNPDDPQNLQRSNPFPELRPGALSQAFRGLPPYSKAIAAIVFFFYVVTVIYPDAVSFLGIVPYNLLSFRNFYIWTILTSGFLETSLINAILNVGGILLFGKLFEPLWSSNEFLRFVLVVNTFCGVATLFVIAAIGILINESVIYQSWYGFGGIIGALAVAIKQMSPETEMKFLGFIPMRAKFFPLVIVTLSVVSALLGMFAASLPHVFLGTFIGWMYLRFFQRRGDLVGDMSDTFTFTSFFPEPAQPIISQISNICWKLTPCLRPGQPRGLPLTIERQPSTFSISDPAEAERRRQRALHLLNEAERQSAQEALSSAASLGDHRHSPSSIHKSPLIPGREAPPV